MWVNIARSNNSIMKADDSEGLCLNELFNALEPTDVFLGVVQLINFRKMIDSKKLTVCSLYSA